MLRRFACTAVVAYLAVGPAAAISAADTAPAANHVAATIHTYKFAPDPITARVGDSVTWTNHDKARHDVAATSPAGLFESPEFGEGESWTVTFASAGTIAYTCIRHPEMIGTIEVLAAPIVPVPASVNSRAPTTATVADVALPVIDGASSNRDPEPLLVVGAVVAVATMLTLAFAIAPVRANDTE